MQDLEVERKRFEATRKPKTDLTRRRGQYANPVVEQCWQTWIEAKTDVALISPSDWRERAAVACEAERVDARTSGTLDDLAYNRAIDHCAAAIRALDACPT